MLGDCLERMKEIDSGSVDMVLADPPYGTTQCKWDSIIPLEPMWKQLKRIIKPNGAVVMTASQPFTTTLIASNMKMFRYEWIWEKPKATGHLNSKKRPMVAHENVLVFYGEQVSYNPQKVKGEPYGFANRKDYSGGVYSKAGGYREGNLEGMRYPRSVQLFSTPHHPQHPTQKPVALMEYLIKTYTNEGEKVLDFTAGSFTTGVACVNLNRKFIGIEMDKDYFDIGVNRIKERIKCLDLKIEPEINTED
jgi:site-specific DNA-methyltransferase (adenine-specific)